jgi:hypothetical protein
VGSDGATYTFWMQQRFAVTRSVGDAVAQGGQPGLPAFGEAVGETVAESGRGSKWGLQPVRLWGPVPRGSGRRRRWAVLFVDHSFEVCIFFFSQSY